MIDSHCHFDLPAFDGKRSQILTNCKYLGIDRLLVPGLTLMQFQTLLALKNEHAELDITLGCHPYFLEQLSPAKFNNHMTELAATAQQNENVIAAIGECGLDGSLPIAMDYQQRVLREQIQIAKDVAKPLVLHHRRSHNELIRILKQEKFSFGGVVHAFSGSEQIAKTYIELGFSLGVGGTITYERAIKTRAAIASINLQHILLETDAPDMPVFGYQGQHNTPERLPLIAKELADLHNCSVGEVQTQTTINYQRVFLTS